MVGPSSAEVIHEAAMALRFRAKLRDFIDLLHVYPTMAEALKIVAISRYKDPAKLYWTMGGKQQIVADSYLFHTDEDKGVPPENSVAFYLALRKAGVPE